MSRVNIDTQETLHAIAVYAVRLYARGILTSSGLVEQMRKEWGCQKKGDEEPTYAVLMRIAQRICSRALYEAWCSSDIDHRNNAFDNIRCYLKHALLCSNIASSLCKYTDAVEDVLHQTLETLHLMLVRQQHPGPDDPAAFLRWTEVIVYRHANVFLKRHQREAHLSLETEEEQFFEQFIDKRNSDPLEQVLQQELRQKLGDVLLSMRNPRYRQVLVYTYLIGMGEQELAHRLHVQEQDIYLWRHRALKTLRSKPEVMNMLRSLRE